MSGENAPFQIDVSGKTRWMWTCWSDMTDSNPGLPRFLAIHFLFQGSQAQRERLRAIFIPSSCSNLYSSTSVRTSEFAHPWTWGSAIQSQSVTSHFSLAVYQEQHHAGSFMKIPFAPQVGARCWGRWCYRLVVSIWTGSARRLWPKSPQHASKQWWSPLGLIKENGMNLISEDSFESSKTIQFSKISIVAELPLKSFPQATDSMPWLRSFCPLAGEVWSSRGLDAVAWLSHAESIFQCPSALNYF